MRYIDGIEVYSKSKDEEDFPHIGMTTGIIATASGKDPLGGVEFTGVTVILRNNWKFKCRTVPASDITIKISGSNTIAEGSNARFFPVDKVHYEFAQSTSPAAIGLSILQTDIDDYRKLSGNTQEWVSPGLLKVYNDGQTFGGTTYAEFKTLDSVGAQTFDITKVRRYERTK